MLTLSHVIVDVIVLLCLIGSTALTTAMVVVSAMRAVADERKPVVASTLTSSVFDIDFDPLFGGFAVTQLRGSRVVASTPGLYTETEAIAVALRLNELAAA